MAKNKHKIRSSYEVEVIRGRAPQVTLYCSCGGVITSNRGIEGAYRAFDKHEKRAKEREKAPTMNPGT